MNQKSFDNFIAQGYNHIPVFKEVVLDTDTALGLYLKLANTYLNQFKVVRNGVDIRLLV